MVDAPDGVAALSRRAVVVGLGAGVAGCLGAVPGPRDGDAGVDGGAEVDAGVLDWAPGPLSLITGGAAVIALADTLPPGVARGGRFGVDASGDPLPAGVTLTPDGLLSGAGASSAAMAQVVFTYLEP